MIYDSVCGLPTKESFFSNASYLVSRNESSRYYMLSLQIIFERKADLLKDTVSNYLLLNVVQNFIRKQAYILLSYRSDEDRIICVLDQSLITSCSLTDKLMEHYRSFQSCIEKEFPYHNVRLMMGLCEHVENASLEETAQYAIEAQKKLNVSNNSYPIQFYKKNSTLYSAMETQLLRMYENGVLPKNILIYLQPRFGKCSTTPNSAEAMIRIMDNHGKLLTPTAFLSVFHKNDLSLFLDLSVMEHILMFMNNWFSNGITPIPIAMHLTMDSLLSPMFERITSMLLDKYHAVASYLQLELPIETIERIPNLEKILSTFLQEGCMVYLESDTLASIVSAIKESKIIDGIIMNRTNMMNQLTANEKFVQDMISNCSKRGIKVIMKNIETPEEADIALTYNISLMQGFLFGRPVPLDVFQKKYLNYIFI